MNESKIADELIALNQKLLDSIANADWKTYKNLCDAKITAIEPEAPGQVVEGLDFHKYYFDLGSSKTKVQTTMCHPVVHHKGDMAVIAYVRLVQKLNANGSPITAASAETRVWECKDGKWLHVHFHRTPLV
ncbi:MAG: DUF4440 domain-containing protein [Planctomycetota bacterium]|jgi:ketosteroid isomerase-like protein|nr:DUF4440 domain-containing protein [Planctomycetota bacterium]